MAQDNMDTVKCVLPGRVSMSFSLKFLVMGTQVISGVLYIVYL